MRIIAGQFRGRKILPPRSEATRPITDRVKQSLFDIISPQLPDAVVYDCFAGTGSMGLESLSRGARHAAFFEADRSALALLEKNIAALRLDEKSRVVPGDLFRWFDSPASQEIEKADVVFLDPPYRFVKEKPQALRKLSIKLAEEHLIPNASVVFRHDGSNQLELPALQRFDSRQYGSMVVELWRPA